MGTFIKQKNGYIWLEAVGHPGPWFNYFPNEWLNDNRVTYLQFDKHKHTPTLIYFGLRNLFETSSQYLWDGIDIWRPHCYRIFPSSCWAWLCLSWPALQARASWAGCCKGPSQGCHSQPLPSHSCIKQMPFPGISHNFFLTFYWFLHKMWLISILSKLSSNMNLYLNTTGSWLYASQANQLAYCFPVIFWR